MKKQRAIEIFNQVCFVEEGDGEVISQETFRNALQLGIEGLLFADANNILLKGETEEENVELSS